MATCSPPFESVLLFIQGLGLHAGRWNVCCFTPTKCGDGNILFLSIKNNHLVVTCCRESVMTLLMTEEVFALGLLL